EHVSDLRHLAVNARIEDVTEAIGADHAAGVNPDAMADFRARIERHIREQIDFLAKLAICAYEIAPLQYRARPDPGILAHETRGSDVGGGIHLRGAGDNGSRVNARCESGLREEQREYFSKRDPGMGDPDQGLAAGSERPLDDDRSGGTLFGPHEIIVIFRKSQVAGLGAISRREAFQHQRWVADDFALQALGNFSNREWH